MLITEVTQENIPQWLELAAEVEPIFQGSMVKNQKFHDDPFPSAPIDYRIIEPNPYQGAQEFMNFISTMRRELEK